MTAADGRAFRLDAAAWMFCFDDPAVPNDGSSASFDSLRGEASGTWDGQAGAVARFSFSDAGTPGHADAVDIEVLDASGATVLAVSGTLDEGNHRAHPGD